MQAKENPDADAGLNTVGRVIGEKVQLRIINTGEGSGADDWQEETEEK